MSKNISILGLEGVDSMLLQMELLKPTSMTTELNK
jgi:hypothetical protein